MSAPAFRFGERFTADFSSDDAKIIPFPGGLCWQGPPTARPRRLVTDVYVCGTAVGHPLEEGVSTTNKDPNRPTYMMVSKFCCQDYQILPCSNCRYLVNSLDPTPSESGSLPWKIGAGRIEMLWRASGVLDSEARLPRHFRHKSCVKWMISRQRRNLPEHPSAFFTQEMREEQSRPKVSTIKFAKLCKLFRIIVSQGATDDEIADFVEIMQNACSSPRTTSK